MIQSDLNGIQRFALAAHIKSELTRLRGLIKSTGLEVKTD